MSKEKEIGELIKEALNGHEESYIDGAWEAFASKRRRRALIYRISASGIAAAVLLGLLIIGTYNQPLPETLTAQEDSQTVTPNTSQATASNDFQASASNDSQTVTSNNSQATASNDSQTVTSNNSQATASNDSRTVTSNNSQATASNDSQTVTSNNSQATASNDSRNVGVEALPKSEVAAGGRIRVLPTAKGKEPVAIAQNIEENKASDIKSNVVAPPATQTQTQQQPTNQLNNQPLTQFNSLTTTESSPQSSKQSSKLGSERRVRIGVNVAPGFNTTEDASAFNYSGGVNVEIPLSKKLQISTGVLIEHSNVDERSSPRNAAVPSYQTIASLTNLDIPVNIIWKISSYKKTNYYVGAGLSALAYLSEDYTTTTRTQLLRENTSFDGDEYISTYKLETIERVTTSSGSPYSAFDIGGRVNLIFGVEQRLSPKLNLSIEPFMKIPVSGLATKNMIYTTGGVTFKVTF